MADQSEFYSLSPEVGSRESLKAKLGQFLQHQEEFHFLFDGDEEPLPTHIERSSFFDFDFIDRVYFFRETDPRPHICHTNSEYFCFMFARHLCKGLYFYSLISISRRNDEKFYGSLHVYSKPKELFILDDDAKICPKMKAALDLIQEDESSSLKFKCLWTLTISGFSTDSRLEGSPYLIKNSIQTFSNIWKALQTYLENDFFCECECCLGPEYMKVYGAWDLASYE